MRSKSRLDLNKVEEKARKEAENLRKFTQKLEDVTKKVDQEIVGTLLKNIFEKEVVTEAMQRKVGIYELKRFIVGETEIQIIREGFKRVPVSSRNLSSLIIPENLWKCWKISSVSSTWIRYALTRTRIVAEQTLYTVGWVGKYTISSAIWLKWAMPWLISIISRLVLPVYSCFSEAGVRW